MIRSSPKIPGLRGSKVRASKAKHTRAVSGLDGLDAGKKRAQVVEAEAISSEQLTDGTGVLRYSEGYLVVGMDSVPEAETPHVLISEIFCNPENRDSETAANLIQDVVWRAKRDAIGTLFACPALGTENTDAAVGGLRRAGFQLFEANTSGVLYRRVL